MKNEESNVCIHLGNLWRQVSVQFYHSLMLWCNLTLLKIHHSATGLFDMHSFSLIGLTEVECYIEKKPIPTVAVSNN